MSATKERTLGSKAEVHSPDPKSKTRVNRACRGTIELTVTQTYTYDVDL